MSLDKEEANEAYRLGRLFAVLEHVQEQAIEGVKATIRSRFLASASASPAMVFPTLLRLSQHHIVKITNVISTGAATFHDKQIQEILSGMPSRFSRSLSLEDQGRFYIGYYHQRSERFKTREKANAGERNEEETGNAQ